MAGPLAAIAIPCFDQERYLGAAIEAAFAQSYRPLEILIADDASRDGSYALASAMAERYDGPHRVKLQRNDGNRGIENYNSVMAMTEADFVVVAHADDISEPDRVAKMVAAWQAHGVSLVSSNALLIDAEGREGGLAVREPGRAAPDLEAFCREGWQAQCHGATLGWAREVFDVFGGLSKADTSVSTDWILPFRACLLKGIHYVDEPLIRRRVHAESRSEVFLHSSDRLINAESNLGNRLIQMRYMHVTLKRFIDGGGALEDWRRYDELILKTFVQTATHWAQVRNALLAERKRAQWVDR